MSNRSNQLGAPVSELLTPELMNRLATLIATGNYPQVAIRAVGISTSQFRSWMILGSQASEGAYRDFYNVIKDAEAMAEMKMVKSWHDQMDKGYQAPRDFLARRFSSRWAERIELSVAVRSQLEEILSRLKVALPMEIFAQVAAALGSDETFAAYMDIQGVEDELGSEMEEEDSGSTWSDYAR